MSNSIKNTRIRVKDVKHGLVMYRAHPVYGIEKYVVQGKPYLSEHGKSLFVKVYGKSLFVKTLRYSSLNGECYKSEISLTDAGITKGDSYNGRRSFRKLKQAEAWVVKWGKSPTFIKQHQRHLHNIKYLSYLGGLF